MAERTPPVELYYDPAELDPDAPRLHVHKNGVGWELRDMDGDLLGAHPTQDDAIDAALGLSQQRFSEILVRGPTGRAEWAVRQDPEWLNLVRAIDRDLKRRGEEGKGRLRMNVGAFCGHHVFLPVRRRRHEAGDCRAPAAARLVERVYDPADLDPAAPRLHIRKKGGRWELRDDAGQLLSRHGRLPSAMDAALTRSEVCFSEILIQTVSGRIEWSLRHNPDWTEVARLLNQPAPAEQEAAD